MDNVSEEINVPGIAGFNVSHHFWIFFFFKGQKNDVFNRLFYIITKYNSILSKQSRLARLFVDRSNGSLMAMRSMAN
jgi:hypothetical protein